VHVALCDIDAEGTEATTRELAALGVRSTGTVLDALDTDALDAFFDSFDESFDRLDIAVNVVGGVFQRNFLDSTPDQWSHDIHRNYGHVLHAIHHEAGRMRAGGRGGSIVSLTTIESFRGAAGFAVYAGAKAALTNFSRTLAVELGADRIRVNTVAPDTTPSKGNASALPPEALEERMRSPRLGAHGMRAYIPMGTAPAPEDIADAVLFLASDLSSMVTGTTIHVDGGTWAASGFVRWPIDDVFLPAPTPGMLARLFPDDV
jgi:NAD(P)-dependent dehydrogenase (short-subunit alcohol dehydrogenase family)